MKHFFKSLGFVLFLAFTPGVVHALPAGYTRLEYIESDGKAYINTGQFGGGIIPTLNTVAEIRYSLTSAEGWPALFGARTDSAHNAFNVWARINSSNVVGANFGSRSPINSTVTYTLNVPYFVSLSNGKLSVTNTSSGNTVDTSFSGVGSLNQTKPMYLFDINGGGTSVSGTGNRRLVGKIYYFKVYESNVLVLDMIPAKNSSGVIGMYDNISGKFFTNVATDSGAKFTAGPVAGIKVATKAYNDQEFAPVKTRLNSVVSAVNNVVSNTITQATSIGGLKTSKQNRPGDNNACPEYRQCLLVQDTNNNPNWFPILDPFYDLLKPIIAQNVFINIHNSTYDYGYTQLDYISSNGSSYIDTGISGLNSGNWEIYAKWLMNNVTQSTYSYVVGAYQAETYNAYRIITNQTANNSYYVSGNSKAGGGSVLIRNIAANAVHTGLIRNGSVVVDGVTYSTLTNGTTIPADKTIGLFRRSDGVGGNMKGRIYESWAKKNDVYQYRMIPAQSKTGGVGMYDTVSKTFFQSATSTAFTAGNTVANTDVPAEQTWSVEITGNESGGTNLVAGTVYGTAKCNALSGTANTAATSANLESSSWTGTGNNCWCAIDMVELGDTSHSRGLHQNPTWVYNGSDSSCASHCARACVDSFIDGTNGAFRTAISGVQ